MNNAGKARSQTAVVDRGVSCCDLLSGLQTICVWLNKCLILYPCHSLTLSMLWVMWGHLGFASPYQHMAVAQYLTIQTQCQCCSDSFVCRQLRARRALLQLKDVPLRTRRVLLLYKVNGNSALLVLNGTSLICNNALLTLSWWCILIDHYCSLTPQIPAVLAPL